MCNIRPQPAVTTTPKIQVGTAWLPMTPPMARPAGEKLFGWGAGLDLAAESGGRVILHCMRRFAGFLALMAWGLAGSVHGTALNVEDLLDRSALRIKGHWEEA